MNKVGILEMGDLQQKSAPQEPQAFSSRVRSDIDNSSDQDSEGNEIERHDT
jgi:hypothetical protein